MRKGEGLAAAFGSGVKADDSRSSAVVDIGGGTTNVAIVASGKIIELLTDALKSLVDHFRRCAVSLNARPAQCGVTWRGGEDTATSTGALPSGDAAPESWQASLIIDGNPFAVFDDVAGQIRAGSIGAPVPGTAGVSFPLGAFHAAELPYLFEGPDLSDQLSPAQARLSRQMTRYWVRFTATGLPYAPATLGQTR